MDFGFLEDWGVGLWGGIVGNFWSILIILVLLLSFMLYMKKSRGINVFSYITISLPKELIIGNIPITINKRNKKLAYDIWVELKTRKIALDFDKKDDVIIEVYDSWYDSFKLIREYIKDIGEKSVNDNLRKISLEIINDVMRPHLTKYQSRFRKWFEKNYEGVNAIQEFQKDFPDYLELVKDIQDVNSKCQEYLVTLEKIFR